MENFDESILEQLDELEKNQFEIKDDKTADWALKKIKEQADEYERLEKLGKEEIAEIQDKLASEKSKYESTRKFFTSCLAKYFKTVPHKETKTLETYNLLSGKLVSKKKKYKIEPNNNELVDYLKQNNMDELIEVKESPKWQEFKKGLSIQIEEVEDLQTGEIVESRYVVDEEGNKLDCVSITTVDEQFDVKF